MISLRDIKIIKRYQERPESGIIYTDEERDKLMDKLETIGRQYNYDATSVANLIVGAEYIIREDN